MTAVLKRRNAAPARSHAERREEAEQRMLRSAVEILAAKGFAGFTLNDVGEAAGFSRGLPAHYYGTKENMVGVLVGHIVERFNQSLKTRPRLSGLASLLDSCGAYFLGAAADPTAMRALLLATTEAMINPAVATALAEVNAHSIEGLARKIRSAQSGGEIRRDVKAYECATLILGQMRGAITLWLAQPDAIDIDRLRTEFIARLKQGLQP